MADVTEELTAQYAEWSHAELVREIADLSAIIRNLTTEVEESEDERKDAEREARAAKDEVEGAKLDGIYAAVDVLKAEARYHDGMAGGTGRSPIGNLYADAIKDIERGAPEFVGQLV